MDEGADTVVVIFGIATEIYEIVTVNATFAILAMAPHFAATWTGIGFAANEILTLESRRLGWASVVAARAPPRATFEI